MTREIETWLSDSRIGNNSVVDEGDRILTHCVCVCVCVRACVRACVCVLSVCPSEMTWPLLSSVVGIISYTEYLFLLCVLTSM